MWRSSSQTPVSALFYAGHFCAWREQGSIISIDVRRHSKGSAQLKLGAAGFMITRANDCLSGLGDNKHCASPPNQMAC